MSLKNRKWIPLQSGLAWIVTRDADVCGELIGGPHETIAAVSRVEQEILAAGCFEFRDEYFIQIDSGIQLVEGDPDNHSQIRISRPLPKEHFLGRFYQLAADYERAKNQPEQFRSMMREIGHDPESFSGILTFRDYLMCRWHEAFRTMCLHLADGKLSARGVEHNGRITLPASQIQAERVTAKWRLEWNGDALEQQPRDLQSTPIRWTEVSVELRSLSNQFKEFRRPSVNDRKREATREAIAELGVKKLEELPQDVREDEIIRYVREKHEVDVKPRSVRNRFKEAQKADQLRNKQSSQLSSHD